MGPGPQRDRGRGAAGDRPDAVGSHGRGARRAAAKGQPHKDLGRVTVRAAVWETTRRSTMTTREPSDVSDGARLRRLEANLEVLDGLLAALTGVLSLRQALDRVSEIAQKVIAHDAMTVIRPTEDRKFAHVYAVRGFGPQPEVLSTRLRGPS